MPENGIKCRGLGIQATQASWPHITANNLSKVITTRHAG